MILICHIIAKAVCVVQQSVLRDPEVWERALHTWSRLKASLNNKKTRKRKREEEQNEEEEKHPETKGAHPRDTQRDVCQLQTHPEQPKPTFRVSCRSSGVLTKRFSPQVCLGDSGNGGEVLFYSANVIVVGCVCVCAKRE